MGTKVSLVSVTVHGNNLKFRFFLDYKKFGIDIEQFVMVQIAVRTAPKMLIKKLSR